jgi:biotin synthase-related radical SAM superfamily protein
VKPLKKPRYIRVSLGSAITLGLLKGSNDAPPTTIYLLTYYAGKCRANCSFCPQARESHGRSDLLSRVTWPKFSTITVIQRIGELDADGQVRRVCIQAVNYAGVYNDVLSLVKALRAKTSLPISISCQPFTSKEIEELKNAGIERMSIPIDAATPEIFHEIKGEGTKGPYSWRTQMDTLREANDILGEGKVSTHLIVGLGETEQEMITMIQEMKNLNICPGLFAFTPIKGTKLEKHERPNLKTYRKIQLARHLIVKDKTRLERMRFDENGSLISFGVPHDLLKETVLSGDAFKTSGCPDCNRPYYNEAPGGPIYNYPRKLLRGEIEDIRKQFGV